MSRCQGQAEGPAVMLDADMTVEQALEACPQASHAFITLHTDCVGCYLVSFCTLREVAESYHLPLDALLQALSQPIPLLSPPENRLGDR